MLFKQQRDGESELCILLIMLIVPTRDEFAGTTDRGTGA